jgi:hypothetical protein
MCVHAMCVHGMNQAVGFPPGAAGTVRLYGGCGHEHIPRGTTAVAQRPPADPNPQAANPQGLPTFTEPTVQVIGTTPLPGTGIDRDKMLANVQSIIASAFQPDILFRGFTASPVVGTPQGMAVYQNGSASTRRSASR